MDEISVKVTKYGDRRHFVMYYRDPDTEKRVTRSTKAENQRDAERAAAKWEAELREGRYIPDEKMTWELFRERYEAQVVPTLKLRTQRQISTAFNALERILEPKRLRKVDENQLSKLQMALRTEGLAEPSIRSYLAHIRSALSWACNQRMIGAVPKIKHPKRAKGSKMMKGRPITGEEFDRMLAKVVDGLLLAADDRRTKMVNRRQKLQDKPTKARSAAAQTADRQRVEAAARAAAPSWARLLTGLRLSGLRLGEALNLSWDDDSKILVDMLGRRPTLRILAELEKGGRDRIHPVTPDFAEFLWATPEAERTGPVFAIRDRQNRGTVGLEWASKVISCIGKAAGVVVDKKSGKFASAHDLRRTFGVKWAKLVMPAVLQQLMRHENIDTTMKYYAGMEADEIADAAWEALARSNSSINSQPAQQKSDEGNSSQTVEPKGVS